MPVSRTLTRAIAVTLWFILLLLISTTAFAQEPTPISRLGSESELLDIQWHPNQQILAVGGDWGVKILSNTLQELAQVPTQGGIVVAVAWHPNGEQLASGGSVGDGAIRIWDWNSSTNSLTLQTTLSNDHEREFALAWSPDGTRLASIGADTTPSNNFTGIVQIWNVQSWGLERTIPVQLYSPVRALAWSPDSTRIAFAGYCPSEVTPCPQGVAGGIYVAEVATGQVVEAISTGNYLPNSLSWSQDEKIAGTESGAVVIYDASTLGRINSFGLDASVNRLAWSPDGSRLAYSYNDALGGILDVTTGARFNFSVDYGYSGRITGLSWYYDGSQVASVTELGAVEIWDASVLPSVTGTATVTPMATLLPTQTPSSRKPGALLWIAQTGDDYP
jgi:WD40 repeat protein